MNKHVDIVKEEDLQDAVTISVEAYISEEYARAERDKLWRKVWLQAGRIEERSKTAGNGPPFSFPPLRFSLGVSVPTAQAARRERQSPQQSSAAATPEPGTGK